MALSVQANEPVQGQWLQHSTGNVSTSAKAYGFNYQFSGPVSLFAENPSVLVFSGSSAWEYATVRLLKDELIVFETSTGIMSDLDSDYFLRNDLKLPAISGDYLLVVDFESRFTITVPTLYLWSQSDYAGRTTPIAILTLLALGVLIALAIQYAVFSLGRIERSIAYYSAFVFLNIVFFANSNLVIKSFLGWNNFELSYAPILFSNVFYILFVNRLLRITPASDPKLWRLSRVILGVMIISIPIAFWNDTIANELNRVNVNLFLIYGLFCGIHRTRHRDRVGAWYLLANLTFVVFGIWSTLSTIGAPELFLQVEQIGLVGMTLESLLLAMIMAYKLHLVERQRISYLQQSEHALSLARSDSLTGIANRFAFDEVLPSQVEGTLLAMLDLDDLKKYNDVHGHQRGDHYIKSFANHLSKATRDSASLYRIGGDEFIILSTQLDEQSLKEIVQKVITQTRKSGFDAADASVGVALRETDQTVGQWIMLADQRMYHDKYSKRDQRSA
ncbi:sensor domain-containing diguanylate cyclase [Alginatibacterium sediminis]|nr:diguanylate cyclase [Alginatibacterium sediminis]